MTTETARIPRERMTHLYESFRIKVCDEQWSIAGWIHEENVSIYELDAVLGFVSASMLFFHGTILRPSAVLA